MSSRHGHTWSRVIERLETQCIVYVINEKRLLLVKLSATPIVLIFQINLSRKARSKVNRKVDLELVNTAVR